MYLCDGGQWGGHGGGQLLGQTPTLLGTRRQGEGADRSWPSPRGVTGQTQGRVDGGIAERWLQLAVVERSLNGGIAQRGGETCRINKDNKPWDIRSDGFKSIRAWMSITIKLIKHLETKRTCGSDHHVPQFPACFPDQTQNTRLYCEIGWWGKDGEQRKGKWEKSWLYWVKAGWKVPVSFWCSAQLNYGWHGSSTTHSHKIQRGTTEGAAVGVIISGSRVQREEVGDRKIIHTKSYPLYEEGIRNLLNKLEQWFQWKSNASVSILRFWTDLGVTVDIQCLVKPQVGDDYKLRQRWFPNNPWWQLFGQNISFYTWVERGFLNARKMLKRATLAATGRHTLLHSPPQVHVQLWETLLRLKPHEMYNDNSTVTMLPPKIQHKDHKVTKVVYRPVTHTHLVSC